jgi:hypothetical protein
MRCLIITLSILGLLASCDEPGGASEEPADVFAALDEQDHDAAPEIRPDADAADDAVPPEDDVLEIPLGTAENPIRIDALPYVDWRDGVDAPSDLFDAYAPCAPEVDESGSEWLYVVTLVEAGMLRATLDEVEGDGIDMDVHILTAPLPDACISRGHAKAAAWLEPGTYWIAVDTWVDGDGIGYPGPYQLDVTLLAGGLLPEQAGFNDYVIQAINDQGAYPKNGTYGYCFNNQSCEPPVDIYFGMVHDGYYLGERLFEGTGRCYCCGHTLEIFLDAYIRYQLDTGTPESEQYGGLTLADMDVGAFYQHWFGWGAGDVSSSANALEYAGIGVNLYYGDWDKALPGDFVNFSRSNGTGHAVVFVDWVEEGGVVTGMRYYSCNGSGESHPDPDDPDNVHGVSGPSFQTEYFTTAGGSVLKDYVFIGRAFDPAEL